MIFNNHNVKKLLNSKLPSKEGGKNTNYFFNVGKNRFILRKVRSNGGEIDLKKTSESKTVTFLNKIEYSGIPSLVGHNANNRTCIYTYCIGKPLSEINVNYANRYSSFKKDILDKIVDFMVRLHSITDIGVGNQGSPFKYTSVHEFYECLLDGKRKLFAKLIKENKNALSLFDVPFDLDILATNCASQIPHNSKLVLCHADIHQENLILDEKTGNLSLIDGECALKGPMAYELGRSLHLLNLNKRCEDYIVNSYSKRMKLNKSKLLLELKPYRALEISKTALIDIGRLFECKKLKDDIKLNVAIKQYYGKLNRARKQGGYKKISGDLYHNKINILLECKYT